MKTVVYGICCFVLGALVEGLRAGPIWVGWVAGALVAVVGMWMERTR